MIINEIPPHRQGGGIDSSILVLSIIAQALLLKQIYAFFLNYGILYRFFF